MSRPESCARCRWWDQENYSGPPTGDFGFCRGGVPARDLSGMGKWPVTGDEDYCGQFVPTERIVQIAEHEEMTRTLDSPPLAEG